MDREIRAIQKLFEEDLNKSLMDKDLNTSANIDLNTDHWTTPIDTFNEVTHYR